MNKKQYLTNIVRSEILVKYCNCPLLCIKAKVKLLLFPRKHHCRKCGQAVCGKCSSKRSSYPVMGFEFQVRMCDSCYDSIKDEE